MKQKSKSRAAKISESNQGLTVNAATDGAALPRHALPRPFNMHLFTTACMLTAAAWPMASDPAKRDAVLRLVSDMADEMMRGVGAYKQAEHRAVRAQHAVVWQKGSSRLLRIEGAKKNAVPVLLVPSLINRYDILDLDAQHSFTLFLRDEGFAPYIIDWGQPGEDERQFTVDDYILDRLYPALENLNRPHVVGYCMGGTMAAGAIAALDNQTNIRSLSLLAAPWDFHAGDDTIAARMHAFALTAEGVMQATGVLPVDWIQALFSSIDPLFAFNKFRSFADMDADSPEARRFVIVENWLNDGVDLTAPAARQALMRWYGDNEPANGVWTVGKKLVDAASIRVPTLVVAAGNDRLVPQPAALALYEQMAYAQIAAAEKLTPEIGHIGMMASTRAKALVWEKLAGFLRQKA